MPDKSDDIYFETVPDEQKFHLLVDSVADYAIYMLDPEGRVASWNNGARRLKKYAAEEIIGQHFRIFYTDEDQKSGEPESALKTAREKGKYEATGWRVCKDGSRFIANVTIYPIYDKTNNFVGFAKVTHDVTERKRTEDQLVQAQKMEIVGQLSGGIAHDFNNLLTVIIGNADLLGENLKSRPDLKSLCDTVVGAGERGAELARRLLAFSRKQTLQPAIVDCGDLVKGMRILLRRTLSEDIDIDISADPRLMKAFADPSQLESAVLNLALNARDAMPNGGHLHVTLSNASLDKDYQNGHPDVKPGNYIMIAVTDDGEGMTPDVRAHVFEPFFTTKEVGKGSGLGLSMVYGFVKQSNGHIAVYSEPGLGTTVRLYLPAAKVIEATEPNTQPVVDLAALRGTETVLVAEDDPFVRNHAVASLESLGYNVIAAPNGQEALAKLNQNPSINVLFSDVVMPGGMTGWDLVEQAQKQRPDLKILLTSGYPLETLASRGRHNPGIALLNKPYRKIDLGRRLREILAAPPANYTGIIVPAKTQMPAAAASSM